MEHIFTLTSIIDHAPKNDLSLTITFIDFKNAFGSISHSFVKDTMFHMKVHDNIIKYITNPYGSLTGFIHSSSWVTSVFPITCGVFQGDIMSPIIFLMALTPVVKMMGKIDCSISISQSPKAKTFHVVEQSFKCYEKRIILEPKGWYKSVVLKNNSKGDAELLYPNGTSEHRPSRFHSSFSPTCQFKEDGKIL